MLKSTMTRRSFGRLAGAGGMIAALPALGAETEPALVYDYGGKWDKSFNEAAYNGAERFRAETGIAYREIEITNESQREQVLLTFAKRGAALVVGVGFGHQAAMTRVAQAFPQERFTIIDTVIDLPNVQSIVFREPEGCFLVGMLAALATKTGTIGFVGGMDIPLIRRVYAGYAEGARFVDPKIEVLETMTGTTAAAWSDPPRGAELARSQLDRGADVVFAAAGATGLGALQAVADAGKLSIGVDSNQNPLHPGSVLTSMVKRVDVAVYHSLMAAHDGSWKTGTLSLGLKEDGLDWALDDNNRALVTPAMQARVEQAKADILSGKLVVQAK
jgi:basic membrane protein A and related proteins